jgi:hypothetical protein
LVRDEKAIAEKQAAELKAATEKREQEKAMQTHIENLVLIMRQKSVEREMQLAVELEKEQEILALQKEPVEVEPPAIPKPESSEYNKFINDEISRRLIQDHHRIISAVTA